MYKKSNPFIPDSYLKDNINKNNRPYRARNILSKNNYAASVFSQENPQEPTPPTEQPVPAEPQEELPPGDVPALPAEPGTIPTEERESVGYISVGVFTASGALPVEDAVVTIYTIDEAGEENALYHVVSDASGQVPLLELPVVYDRLNPLESYEYYFSTYNLRVQAINYYTFNMLDVRVFPDTTTNYMVDLIPVAAGPGGPVPEMTFVIPPSPIDISND
ncbi:MAG: hypothetical protein AB7V48_08330 [Sedimentibacter sp.]